EQSITVIGGGSGVGIAALIDGEVEIAMASRSMKDSEIEEAKQNGINPLETVIGWDGIAVVVNPENPVSQLTFTQLKAIYDGNVSNWKDVGGEDRQITVISRDSSSGTYEYFKEEILVESEYRQDALVQPATGAIVQEIAQNKGAIGYIGYAYLDTSTKALALDGGEGVFVPATEEKILSGEYPLARQLYYYTNGEPQGLAKEFIEYIMSGEGQAIVSDVGYFPAK
ncbi:PstS family phosphate ABC transporter substrate-binding protein, partial [Methanomethylovorans sp.]|uniref:PstS family phosphate ABC transporter substrate-binding protein n=1 Tax=Methanomethylovorans sp. TaxID=2758717 RepID=UPI00351C9BB6